MSSFLRRVGFISSAFLVGTMLGFAIADEHPKLPPGPIHDRHELMEGVGKNAKLIGASLKAGKPADAAKPGEAIAGVVDKFITLFPPGSTHPASRAKPEIWQDKTKFEQLAGDLKNKATAFAAAARDGGDVKATSDAMWKACKSCHDPFRVPKPGE